MKIADEPRPDGSTRYRVQHRDPQRPGKYTTRRFDDRRDAAEFVRRAKVELADALAWDEERRGGVSFRGQAGRPFIDYARDFVATKTRVKEKTRNSDLSDLRTIGRVEWFAQMQIGAITRTDVERFKRELSALRLPRGGAMKSRTKNGLLDVAFETIRHAVMVGDIAKDVTMGVEKFRVTDAKKSCPVTVPEFDSIMVHVAPDRRPLFRTLLDSGMRIGEALALEWVDVRETAHGIYEILVWGEGDSDDGKTENAQRVTTIPAETFKAIPRTDERRVFPLTYSAAAAEWRKAVQRAQSPAYATEFPPLTKRPVIHDLRHTHAGFLITGGGFNLALVADRLGHKDIGITKKYYGRLVKEQTHELGIIVARIIPRGVVE